MGVADMWRTTISFLFEADLHCFEALSYFIFVPSCLSFPLEVSEICSLFTSLFFGFVFPRIRTFAEEVIQRYVAPWLVSLGPGWLRFLDGYLRWPITIKGLTIGIVFALVAYGLIFGTYLIMRYFVLTWDKKRYQELTGVKPGPTPWSGESIPQT